MNNKSQKSLGRLWGYIRRYPAYLMAAFLSALAAGVFLLAGPYLIGRAVDYMVDVGQVDFVAIGQTLLLMAVAYLISVAGQWLTSVCSAVIAARLVRDMRAEAFESISGRPLSFFDGHARGDLISRLVNDSDAVAEGIQQGLTQLLPGVVTILGVIVFMLLLSPLVTLAVVVIAPLSVAIASFIVRRSNKMFRQQAQTLGEVNGYIEEMIGNGKVVRAFSYEDRSQEAFEEINERLYTCGQKAQFYSSLTNPTTRLINTTIYVVVGILSGLLALAGGLTVGAISSFLSYSSQFARPINDITSVSAQMQNAAVSAQRVFELIDAEGVESDMPDAKLLQDCQGQVEFRGVTFSYDGGRPLIENLSFSVESGSRIAIVGPTGAGKTTLVNLLMRFYEVDSGEIFVDGQDIRTFTRHSLRKSFGMVLQDAWLFEGTISENVAFGRPDATREQIEAVCRACFAHNFIRRLPEKYDTRITEGGGNLSQGQKQLLTIARAMLHDPPMLILDEATSNVDSRTEAHIQQAFARLMQGRTSFVIAHRLSTIRESDRILVMDKGNVIEQGTHEELLEAGGFYAQLYQGQFS
ncbi:MAG: ABC transporter ATP-binding protein [Christensenellales bacterium]|jgi:ATP-binding cassette subfamily B multidrug efflux pump